MKLRLSEDLAIPPDAITQKRRNNRYASDPCYREKTKARALRYYYANRERILEALRRRDQSGTPRTQRTRERDRAYRREVMARPLSDPVRLRLLQRRREQRALYLAKRREARRKQQFPRETRERRQPLCHPDREHNARGLCAPCYKAIVRRDPSQRQRANERERYRYATDEDYRRREIDNASRRHKEQMRRDPLRIRELWRENARRYKQRLKQRLLSNPETRDEALAREQLRILRRLLRGQRGNSHVGVSENEGQASVGRDATE